MKFISPLKVLKGKVKTFILNLNNYRNTHYRVLNNCKINYKALMSEQILKSKNYNKIICVYKVYAGTQRSFDLGNVCSVHEKFFEDALVELGKLPDDNISYIPLVVYMGCGIDRDEPRVEIEVIEFSNEGLAKLVDIIYNEFKEKDDGTV